jgi:hypothetical protein
MQDVIGQEGQGRDYAEKIAAWTGQHAGPVTYPGGFTGPGG